MFKALGGHWHPTCFVCTHCSKPFGPEVPFIPHEGKPYCEDDFADRFCDKCCRCDKGVLPRTKVQTLGKIWHKDCITCMTCSRPFTAEGAGVKVFQYENMPMCQVCVYMHMLYEQR